MVHKRYITRGGKRYGPYFYKSVRLPDGRVKNEYLGQDYDSGNEKKVVQQDSNGGWNGKGHVFLSAFIILSAFLLAYVGFFSFTGGSVYAVEKEVVLENYIGEELKIGQEYVFVFSAESMRYFGDVVYTQDSSLFELDKEGRAHFVLSKKDKGTHYVTFIAKNRDNLENYYMKTVEFDVK